MRRFTACGRGPDTETPVFGLLAPSDRILRHLLLPRPRHAPGSSDRECHCIRPRFAFFFHEIRVASRPGDCLHKNRDRTSSKFIIASVTLALDGGFFCPNPAARYARRIHPCTPTLTLRSLTYLAAITAASFGTWSVGASAQSSGRGPVVAPGAQRQAPSSAGPESTSATDVSPRSKQPRTRTREAKSSRTSTSAQRSPPMPPSRSTASFKKKACSVARNARARSHRSAGSE